MRIAMVTDSFYPTVDGVVVSLMTTKSILEKMGHTVFIVAPDPGEKDRIEGVQYFSAVKFSGYEGYYVPILPSNKMEIMKALDVDVIHVHGIAVMALKALICAHTLKLPIIITFHTMVGDTMKYYSPVKMPQDIAEKLVWIYIRAMLGHVDSVVTPTASIKQELEEKGVRAREIRVIPTGIDTDHFSMGVDAQDIIDRHSLQGKKVVACVGRLSFEKEIDLVIRAVAQLGEDVVLMIVGSGPAEGSLRDQVHKSGLESRVLFTGYVKDDELLHHYAASDIIVSASRFETQGLSVLEAMACGLPAVCSNARAFSDIIKDGYNGYLFDGTAEGCADAIRKALADTQGLSEGARATAESFSVVNSGLSLVSAYEHIIEIKAERLKR